MAISILLKFLTLKWDISRTIWRIEVSDGSLFLHFSRYFISAKPFFDQSLPLTLTADIKNSLSAADPLLKFHENRTLRES